MIATRLIEDFWLYWLRVEVLSLQPNIRFVRSYPKDRGGQMLAERITRSMDDWAKPHVAEWWQEDIAQGLAPVDRPLTKKERSRFTTVLIAMKESGLVEIERMPTNQRIAWVRLTTKGIETSKRVFKDDDTEGPNDAQDT